MFVAVPPWAARRGGGSRRLIDAINRSDQSKRLIEVADRSG
ncbi:hypothetical protein [Burkholderia pseudomallei]